MKLFEAGRGQRKFVTGGVSVGSSSLSEGSSLGEGLEH